MLAFIFIPLGALAVAFGVCTLLLGAGCGDGDGLLASVVRFSASALPARLLRLLEATGLPRLCCGALSCVDRALNTPNPVVQIGYLLIVCGAFEAFRRNGFPLIYASPHLAGSENPYFGSAQCAQAYVLLAAALAAFAAASFADPGVVTRANVAGYRALYAYDGLLFPATAEECDTCKQPKPARSKHCKVCNRCVAKFDHHW